MGVLIKPLAPRLAESNSTLSLGLSELCNQPLVSSMLLRHWRKVVLLAPEITEIMNIKDILEDVTCSWY